jgi:ubiquitin C-terminal hydrolase
MLFDTLEENLKGTSLQSHLKDTVGGLIGNETRSTEEEFPYVGEREEPFFAI